MTFVSVEIYGGVHYIVPKGLVRSTQRSYLQWKFDQAQHQQPVAQSWELRKIVMEDVSNHEDFIPNTPHDENANPNVDFLFDG